MEFQLDKVGPFHDTLKVFQMQGEDFRGEGGLWWRKDPANGRVRFFLRLPKLVLLLRLTDQRPEDGKIFPPPEEAPISQLN